MRLLISRSHIRISELVEFLPIPGLFLFFVLNFIELLFVGLSLVLLSGASPLCEISKKIRYVLLN